MKIKLNNVFLTRTTDEQLTLTETAYKECNNELKFKIIFWQRNFEKKHEKTFFVISCSCVHL